MKKVLVVLGPTSSGKTDIGIKLAKKFNGEIIACDSRQVYKGLDIGTGKLPSLKSKIKYQRLNKYWLMDGVKVWMYDVADPLKQFSVKDYSEEASKILDKILSQGKLPILVVGTGLYLRGLIEGFSHLGIPASPSLRKKLDKLSLEDLQKKVRSLSEKRWQEMNQSDRSNPRRLIRTIEILSSKRSPSQKIKTDWNILKVGLKVPREVLNKRINQRLEKRINEGLIEEGESLITRGLTLKRLRELGLEYKSVADLLEKKSSFLDFKRILKVKIHQYAKRQMTWFKNPNLNPGRVNWFDITDKTYPLNLERLIKEWYDPAK